MKAIGIERLDLLGTDLRTPAEKRRDTLSDFLFSRLYNERLEHSQWFWWIGYWPARGWEYAIRSLPLRWFEVE